MTASTFQTSTDLDGYLDVAVSGPEQRARDRYVAHKTWLDVDRTRCKVLDISAGGVRMKAPPEARDLGSEIRGMLVCRAGGADIRVMVHGRVVRVEPDGETVGVQFADLPASYGKAVDAVITMLERLEIEAAFLKSQEPKSSPLILRVAVATVVFSASFALAALYLWIR